MKPEERFTGIAESYAKARPGYPIKAVEFILAHCQLKPGDLLIDIGCGTGISSRIFSTVGLKVIGIEPNEDMRKQAELAKQSIKFPIEYRAGSAENTGLPDACAHAVIAAQAFHWFDAQKALLEFKRILRPNGWLILLWNERDELDPFTAAYGKLIKQFADTKTIETKRAQAGNKLLESKLFTAQKKFTFGNEQLLNEEGLLNRALSISYIPKEPTIKDLLNQQLQKLFQQYKKDEHVILKYNLDLYLARCS